MSRRRLLLRPLPMGFCRPVLGWWGAVLLILCGLFMTSAKFVSSQPVVWLPSISSNSCYRGLHYINVFSLDAQGRTYFQANDDIQVAVVKQVAREYGIRFSESQLRELDKTTFIGQDIRQLPAWLDAPVRLRRQFPVGIPASQLPAYVTASRQVSESKFSRAAYFGLRADQRLAAGTVMRWFGMMQQQSINRFHLVTEME